MGFDISVGDDYRTNLVHQLPLLVRHLSLYAPHLPPRSFTTLHRLCTQDDGAYDGEKVLIEALMLKEVLLREERPYFDSTAPRHFMDFNGLRFYPTMVQNAQIVTDWVQQIEDGRDVRIQTVPPTLAASQGKLHLIWVTVEEVLRLQQWDVFLHLSATSFRWADGHLFADGRRCEEVPEPFREDTFGWEEVRFSQIRVYDAWHEEIEGLIAIAKDAQERNVQITTSM